jgi:hypothetical protein
VAKGNCSDSVTLANIEEILKVYISGIQRYVLTIAIEQVLSPKADSG